MEACSICLSRRHTLDPDTGSWIPCECLQRDYALKTFKQAGIPEFYWHMRPEHIKGFDPEHKAKKNEITQLYKSILQDKLQYHRLLISAPMGTSKVVGYLLLKAVLAQEKAALVSLEQLTEIFLQKEKYHFRWLRDLPVLQVTFGEEYGPQAVHKFLIKHIVDYRGETRFRTIFVIPDNPSLILKKYELSANLFDHSLYLVDELMFDQEMNNGNESRK